MAFVRTAQRGAIIALLALLVACDSGGTPGALGGAAAHPGSSDAVWTCPMCPQVLEGAPGPCPVCTMPLIGTRTARAWTCLEHPVITEGQEGSCPVCDRVLRPVTMAVSYFCETDADVVERDPGTCSECGAPLVEGLAPLPHGDHNPRHGGQFFMAPDNWHHLEGVLPEPGVFRVYLYDDFTRPLPPSRASGNVSMVLSTSGDDSSGAMDMDVEERRLGIQLQVSPDGEALEARIPAEHFALPLELTVFLRLGTSRDRPPPGTAKVSGSSRFDFLFTGLSRTDAGAGGDVTALAPPDAVPDNTPPDLSGLTLAELGAELAARAASVGELVKGKRWQDLYRPALEAKDLALELVGGSRREALAELPDAVRGQLESAARDVVRGAWLIELHGDAGDGEKVAAAHSVFARGVEVVRAALAAAEGR